LRSTKNQTTIDIQQNQLTHGVKKIDLPSPEGGAILLLKNKSIPVFLLLLSLFISSCNMPQNAISPAEQTAIINASIAETVAAGGEVSPQSADSDPSISTNTPDPITVPTDTPTPSDTPEPDTPTPSNTPIPCNLAKFVSDVSIPDGTTFQSGDTFTKTWRLQNVGSCAWTSGYDIVFSGGDAMDAPASVQLTAGTVNPGQNVNISVDMTAPASEGTYRGNWKLREPGDELFGIENSSSGLFWVEIKVIVPTDTPEPQTVTLHRDPSRSKTVSVGGESSDTRLGIAPNGDALRAFIDFDLDSLAGLSTTSTIQSATLTLSDFSGNSCFEFLHPLKALQINYGSHPDYPGDFNQAPIATLLSVPSGAEISSPINITSYVQDYVDSNGAGHFQIRMELEHDDQGSSLKCLMEWPDPLLNITYLP
jgi:hypothetical protein